ncbi:replication fork protection component Swi3-domain-containing protein [Massariosphaeria phaeospora]|uniref:Chromosome segregation in meiosis protein n=1 Tax=Massariosphaeria phaeospora TaxID=100035 RepID=A0A7C8M8T4_9PLEO|nr:replication fork protection component Swi3-domain-containing protein [Massariosphaeria phaeospora]
MAPASPTAPGVPRNDELDAILNSLEDDDDIFDISNMRPQIEESKQQNSARSAGDSLGIDEEIKVGKTRQPIPKLDENRLLSDPGIPKLRRISKERLKFKGKGHEYGDIVRMLNMYQLWLDDLYPRAKFADGLSMIEKLGHSKRIHYMRKQWIDEGKPKHTIEDEDEEDNANTPEVPSQQSGDRMEGLELDNTANTNEATAENQNEDPKQTEGVSGDDPDEDELDALLAEADASIPEAASSAKPATADDLFADDMEAMEGMW